MIATGSRVLQARDCSTLTYVPEIERPKRTARLELRITDAASDQLDQLAVEEDRTRSDMARILLGEALAARRERGRQRRR